MDATNRQRKTTGTKVKEYIDRLLVAQELPEKQEVFVVVHPQKSTHNHDLLNAVGTTIDGLSQRVHKSVVTKVHELVAAGLRDARDIQKVRV